MRCLSLALCVALWPVAAHAQVEAEFADEFDSPPSPASSVPEPSAPPPAARDAAHAPAPVAAPGSPDASPTSEPAGVTATVTSAEGTVVPQATGEDSQARDDDAFRTHNTWLGAAGGLHVVDAGSGAPGTFRLQLGVDFFSTSDYLQSGDENDWVGGTFSLGWTLNDFLEGFAAVANHANSNSLDTPTLMQVLGDTTLGVKVFDRPMDWLALGGDLRLVVLNAVGDVGPVVSGTSVGFRLGASTDLRRVRDPWPLLTRLSLDYLVDNSVNIAEDVEDARYAALGAEARQRVDEDRHLLRRVERFALGINRVDMLSLGVGVEVPLRAAEDFYVHPLAEFQLGIPVNRQGYDCLQVLTDATAGGPDSCLSQEGLAGAPSTLTLGVRVLPPVRGLSFALGVDIGTTGASTFVREVAPNKPYDVLVALSYAVDPRPRRSEATREVVHEVTRAAAEKPRVLGNVVAAGTGEPVAGVVVRYPGTELTAQLAGDDGHFTSYPLDAGEVNFEVSHPKYETRVCSVQVPPAVTTSAEPVPATAATRRGAPPATPQADAREAPLPGGTPASGTARAEASLQTPAGGAANAPIPLICELVAKPRAELRGTVVNESDKLVSGAKVSLTGPESHEVTSDASGTFTLPALEPGQYQARIDAEGYLAKTDMFAVVSGLIAAPRIVLTSKPKSSQVVLTQKEVKIKEQIRFRSGSAEILPESDGLLAEIADVLIRNPQVTALEVQGHTDNTGTPANNLRLSQARAEAVVQRLVAAGVPATRLTAKGYGDTQPLAPNITAGNRARNRRVQFILQ